MTSSPWDLETLEVRYGASARWEKQGHLGSLRYAKDFTALGLSGIKSGNLHIGNKSALLGLQKISWK